MKRIFFFIFSILLLGLSIALIVGGSKKSPLASSTLNFPEQIQLSSGITYQIPTYVITVSQPSPLIMGTISQAKVNIHPLSTSNSTQYPIFAEGFQVNLEGKLEIANAQIAPVGLIHIALKTDQDTNFTWNITTDQSSQLSGTLWIYLAVQPKKSSSINEEQPLFAIPINIVVTTVLGLRADLALVIGILGSLTGMALIIVFVRLQFSKRTAKKSK